MHKLGSKKKVSNLPCKLLTVFSQKSRQSMIPSGSGGERTIYQFPMMSRADK